VSAATTETNDPAILRNLNAQAKLAQSARGGQSPASSTSSWNFQYGSNSQKFSIVGYNSCTINRS